MLRSATVTTPLDKAVKRQITIDGADYTVAIDAEACASSAGVKRKPEVELRWRQLLSGDAALAVA